MAPSDLPHIGSRACLTAHIHRRTRSTCHAMSTTWLVESTTYYLLVNNQSRPSACPITHHTISFGGKIVVSDGKESNATPTSSQHRTGVLVIKFVRELPSVAHGVAHSMWRARIGQRRHGPLYWYATNLPHACCTSRVAPWKLPLVTRGLPCGPLPFPTTKEHEQSADDDPPQVAATIAGA
eukprot:COSAG01_NODE_521_length_15963_cov_76.378530_9_plen_181_part_00